MNRIASRAWVAMVFVMILVAGMVFFLFEFNDNAQDWVLFSGSPHVYSGNKIKNGIVTDQSGVLLVDFSNGRSYASDETLRSAVLHWTGDRSGNISTPALYHYTAQMNGYDLLNGVYSYADAAGEMMLTIDEKVQQTALEAMGDRKGTVAVYNYKTGQILCAVSTPTFDPDNVPDIAGDETGRYNGVYVNRFIQSVYIPGSIFKIATTAAALEAIPDIMVQSFVCTGELEIDGGKVTCESSHGKQNLRQAFSNSCNCAYAQITRQIGKEKMVWYIRSFGLTDPVCFDGITTAKGNYDVANATALNFAWSGIGQHTNQINPCAFMTFVGAIAGDGIGAVPHIVEKTSVGDETTYSAKTEKMDRILSGATARVLQELLQNNTQVKYGSDNFPGLTVCAKSGTGEVGGDKKPNAMFTGFVADEKYPLAFIVAVEEGGYGSRTCIPILKEVLEACVEAIDG